MCTLYLKLIFQGCSPTLYLDFLSSPPSSLQTYTVANEQGGVRRESIDHINSIDDNNVSSAFLGVGA